jgi:hypothetical protein
VPADDIETKHLSVPGNASLEVRHAPRCLKAFGLQLANHRSIQLSEEVIDPVVDHEGGVAGAPPNGWGSDGYLLGSYRIATAPEPNSSRLTSFKSTCFDSNHAFHPVDTSGFARAERSTA